VMHASSTSTLLDSSCGRTSRTLYKMPYSDSLAAL
jgi:hypothetical protein